MEESVKHNIKTAFRKMTIDDFDKVNQLWLNTKGMGLNTTDDSRKGIAAYLRRNPETCFVAVHEKKIVGAILAGHDGRRGFIYHTAVMETYRNAGIGTQLVDHAMMALRQEGIHKVALVVFSKNETGNLFWERLGFVKRDDLNYRNKNIDELERIDT